MLKLLGPQNAQAIADAARGVAEEHEAYKREPALPPRRFLLQVQRPLDLVEI
jgi:hypothetical protein